MNPTPWYWEDILITFRAYPNPSKKYREVSCVAGIRLRDHAWVRLHPIPFRFLPDERRFKKFDVIRARIQKSTDPRPESHYIDCDSIEKIGSIPSSKNWAQRNELVLPLRSTCLEDLHAEPVGGQSLGVIKVEHLDGLVIEPQKGGWSDKEAAYLSRRGFFDPEVKNLDRPPYRFAYKFRCSNPACASHELSIMDWEVIQSYRRWSQIYGSAWEEMFCNQYEDRMRTTDFHLFVGTMLKHPTSWTCVGIYYPPTVGVRQPSLLHWS